MVQVNRLWMVVPMVVWAACGDDNRATPDAGVGRPLDAALPIDARPDAPPPPPDAQPLVDHDYVVSKANAVPTTQAGHTFLDYGLDVGSATSATPDGKVDNQLGQALGALNALFPIQPTVDVAISTADTIVLLDLKAVELAGGPAQLAIRLGANPNPPACADASDTVCGGHLKGNATFDLAANSPTNAPLVGTIANDTFTTSAAGALTLSFPLGAGTPPLAIHLVGARARASGLSADGITSANIAGVVTQTELKTNVVPVIRQALTGVLAAAGCDPNGDPAGTPACGCTAANTTTGVILLMDGDIQGTAKDCKISDDEILAFPPIQVLLKPDVCSQATCTAPDGLSFGVQVQAVKATIRPRS